MLVKNFQVMILDLNYSGQHSSEWVIRRKKLQTYPPLVEGNCIVSDFQQKVNIFNYYVSNQCSLDDTSSTPPSLCLRTESKLFMVNTSEEKIFSIIWSLNSKKAHGHDNISISMLKQCLIFSKCLLEGKFPNIWKYVQPVHKKNNKELKSNYRPISLLLVCGKTL